MMPCDSNLASRMLLDELSDDETVRFEEHLSSCTFCQSQLVNAAGGEHLVELSCKLLSSSIEIAQWSPRECQDSRWNASSGYSISGLSQAAGLPDAAGSPDVPGSPDAPGAPGAERHNIDLSILSPTDDPDFLGRIGNYEVQGVLGRGGMGIVFRALDRALHRNVAIKVLDPALASVGAAQHRFGLEARAMAAISHEHVVPVYAVDTHRGLPYFAMEYIPGGTLEARIRQHGPLDLISILQIARQIALALAAAHECGLVHRDIKPANVLLDRGTERVRVTDFGLARVSSEASHTRSGFIAGTPQFMSPEQVKGELCTGSSDLFSLGCVMYAMCTGHSPFRSTSIYGSMQRVVHDSPRSLHEQSPTLPDWLEKFIFKLLSKQATQRFENATSVATFLEQEIAYIQNPVPSQLPKREFYDDSSFQKAATPRSGPLQWLFLAIATVAVLATLASLPRFSPSSPNEKPSAETESTETSTAKSESIAIETSSVPLWSHDGINVAKSIADSLDRSFMQSDPPPVSDPWNADIRSLDQAMKAWERQYP
ncbi:MAG: serine/threonine-protein kinase [Pirellula sp.]